jgi:hypothetical protein
MQRTIALSLSAVVATAFVSLAAPGAALAQEPTAGFTQLTFISWVSGGGSASSSGPDRESKAVVRRPKSLYKWDLGAWVGGLGLGPVTNEKGRGGGHGHGPGTNEEDVVGFGGMGLQARYRMRRRWGLELSVGALHSEGEGGTSRDMVPVTASLMYYLTPTSLFQIYGLAGLGVAPTRWSDSKNDTTIGASTAGLAQAGIGAALDLHPLRLHADIRGVIMNPSMGDEHGGPGDGAVPCNSCGPDTTPPDAAREDRNAPLAGTAIHMGASIVF